MLALLVVGGLLAVQEMQTSAFQAHYFSNLSRKANFTVGAGVSSAISLPANAPYDDRLGYSKIPGFVEKLTSRDFEISRQARISEGMADIVNDGYFAPYLEKVQSGLRIVDCRNDSLFQERYPERIFERFEDIALMLVQSLLFIENCELLDPEHPKHNPAVEWDRLAHAVLLEAKISLTGDSRSSGSSTLATQIEKYQHSSEGRTASVHEKLQQMVSAALRAYQQGEDTSAVRRQIVLTYLNTMPLSAKAGFGEVHGLGDGLWVWYGRGFRDVNRILKDAATQPGDLNELAKLYKQSLSLLISQRRPSYYFDTDEAELEQLTNSHLRLLGGQGVITPELRDAALKVKLNRRAKPVPAATVSFVAQKAANAVR